MTDDLTDAQWHQQQQEERQRIEASLAYFRLMFESETVTKGCEQMDVSKFAENTSAYLKAADLRGHEVKASIAGVDEVEFEDGNKLALKFDGKEKKLILNKTNLRRIGDRYGFETDSWTGKPVILYEEKVEFGGNLVPAIRVRVPAPVADDDLEVPF